MSTASPSPESPPAASGLSLPSGLLQRGSRGEAVVQLQQALLALGLFSGPAEGSFGPSTREALQRFQFDERLTADGRYGPRSREALERVLASCRLPLPPRPPSLLRPSSNKSPRKGVPLDAIILHHTASNSARQDLATLRARFGPSAVSAHYLVAPEGTLYQLVSHAEQAWHAGRSALHGQARPSVNARSLGIEITNDGSGHTPFTEAQYQVLEQLLAHLVRRYAVPLENVVGHRDIAPGRKTDPADNFDWARIRRALQAAVA